MRTLEYSDVDSVTCASGLKRRSGEKSTTGPFAENPYVAVTVIDSSLPSVVHGESHVPGPYELLSEHTPLAGTLSVYVPSPIRYVPPLDVSENVVVR